MWGTHLSITFFFATKRCSFFPLAASFRVSWARKECTMPYWSEPGSIFSSATPLLGRRPITFMEVIAPRLQ